MSHALYLELERTVHELNRQIDVVRKDAEQYGNPAEIMRDRNGGFLLTPLLVAKANCLHGMASLKAAKDKK